MNIRVIKYATIENVQKVIVILIAIIELQKVLKDLR